MPVVCARAAAASHSHIALIQFLPALSATCQPASLLIITFNIIIKTLCASRPRLAYNQTQAYQPASQPAPAISDIYGPALVGARCFIFIQHFSRLDAGANTWQRRYRGSIARQIDWSAEWLFLKCDLIK